MTNLLVISTPIIANNFKNVNSKMTKYFQKHAKNNTIVKKKATVSQNIAPKPLTKSVSGCIMRCYDEVSESAHPKKRNTPLTIKYPL